MRLYPDNKLFSDLALSYTNKRFDKNFIVKSKRSFSLILSSEGIFYISNKGLRQVQYFDSNIDYKCFKFGKIELLGDLSTEQLCDKKINRLPSNSYQQFFKQIKYSINEKSQLQLVICIDESGLVSNVWFDIDESMTSNPSISEDINTFLCCN